MLWWFQGVLPFEPQLRGNRACDEEGHGVEDGHLRWCIINLHYMEDLFQDKDCHIDQFYIGISMDTVHLPALWRRVWSTVSILSLLLKLVQWALSRPTVSPFCEVTMLITSRSQNNEVVQSHCLFDFFSWRQRLSCPHYCVTSFRHFYPLLSSAFEKLCVVCGEHSTACIFLAHREVRMRLSFPDSRKLALPSRKSTHLFLWSGISVFVVAQVARPPCSSVGETVGEQSYFFDDAERILGVICVTWVNKLMPISSHPFIGKLK